MKERQENLSRSYVVAECQLNDFFRQQEYRRGDLDDFSRVVEIIEDLADLHEEQYDHIVNIRILHT